MAGSRSACPSGRRAAAPRCRPLSWCSFFGLCAVSWHALPCDAAWPRSEPWQAGGVPGPSATGALVGLGVGRDGGGVARGRAGVAWGEVGLGRAVHDRDRGLGRHGRRLRHDRRGRDRGRLCRGNGRWRDGWSRRLVLARILGRAGARRVSGSRPERSPTVSGWRRPARSGSWSRTPCLRSGPRRRPGSEPVRKARIPARPWPGRG